MRVKKKRKRASRMCVFYSAEQKAPVFSGIFGLPDQYRRYDETVMEFVVNGSGDIFSLSPAL